MTEDEIPIEIIKKGMPWIGPKTPDMLKFEDEYGHKAVMKGKITGYYDGHYNNAIKVRKIDGSNIKTFVQRDWAIKQFHAYLKAKNKTQAKIRKVHYWITKLPFDQRQIPGIDKSIEKSKRTGYRLYKNIKSEALNFNRLLTEARLLGLIDPLLFIDKKNPKIRRFFSHRYKAAINSYNINLRTGGSLNFLIDDMNSWEQFIYMSSINARIQTEKFYNQSHRLVVVVEKVIETDDLARICRKHGADYMELTGQPSVTREYQEVTFAKNDDGRPLHIIYISDLDEAGLSMVKAFERNVQILYPHKDHIFKRLILTREQAKGLPASFELDDKGISETQKARFREETGSDVCIELDALDEDVIAEIVDDYLKQFSGIKQDKINTEQIRKEANAPIQDAKDSIKIEANKKEYKNLKRRHVELVDNIREFWNGIAGDEEILNNDIYNFKRKLKEQINKKLNQKKKI